MLAERETGGPTVTLVCCAYLFVDSQGTISRTGFDHVFRSIIEESGADITPRIVFVLAHLFDVFDTDRSGQVDFVELTSGLSVLCGGDAHSKIRAAFELYGTLLPGIDAVRLLNQPCPLQPAPTASFRHSAVGIDSRMCCAVRADYDGDGFISLDEMQTYLASVFKMLYATQPGTHDQMGVSASELAAATAAQCFADADANGDGQLSFAEFRDWCLSSGMAPATASPVKDVVMSATHAKPSWVSQGEIKRLTNLGVCALLLYVVLVEVPVRCDDWKADPGMQRVPAVLFADCDCVSSCSRTLYWCVAELLRRGRVCGVRIRGRRSQLD